MGCFTYSRFILTGYLQLRFKDGVSKAFDVAVCKQGLGTRPTLSVLGEQKLKKVQPKSGPSLKGDDEWDRTIASIIGPIVDGDMADDMFLEEPPINLYCTEEEGGEWEEEEEEDGDLRDIALALMPLIANDDDGDDDDDDPSGCCQSQEPTGPETLLASKEYYGENYDIEDYDFFAIENEAEQAQAEEEDNELGDTEAAGTEADPQGEGDEEGDSSSED